jgi:tripartite-type tricarboxylate transporter receptor subunit TctC
MTIARRANKRGHLTSKQRMRNADSCIAARFRRLLLLLVLTAGAAGPALAFPTKVVTLVVPFPAGGVVDIVGRLLADKLGASLGVRVIVENRPGAGGTLGAAFVARAQPDGHTLLVGGAATHVFSPVIYPSVPYDPVKSFAPVIQLTSGPLVLVVPQSSPVATFHDFQEFVRREGERLNYASNGPGTFPHLAAELYKQATGAKFIHVPYSGGSQAILALLSNDVGFSINHIPIAMPMVKSGKLKAIATTGRNRSTSFPDLPTFSEAGTSGFETSAWFALFAPAGTPGAVIAKLNAEAAKALNSRDLRDKLALQGDEVVGGSPEHLAAYLNAELAKWPAVVKAAKVTAQ